MNIFKHVIGGIIYAAFITAGFVFTLNQVFAVGLGISPSQIQFKNDIIRGTTINRTITLNRSESNSDILFTIEKNFKPINAANWITINNNQPITFNKGENQLLVDIRIEIPQEADNNDYAGSVRFIANSTNSDDNSVMVNLNALLTINFNISDKIIRDYTINNIEINDFEESYSLPLTISLANEGNVPAQPEKISIDIYDDQKSSFIEQLKIEELSKTTALMPFSDGRIRLKINNNITVGQYWADVKITDKEETLYEKEIIFNVIELDGINRDAIIENLSLSNNKLNKNETLTITGDITNSGKIKIKPKIVLKIFRNNILIDILDERLDIIDPQAKAQFTFDFTPEESGNYDIIGHAEFSGLTSPETATTFEVLYPKSNIAVLIGSITIFFILIISVHSLNSSNKKKKTSRKQKLARRRRK